MILGAQSKVNADPLKHFDEKLKISKDTNFLLKIFNGLGGTNVMVDSGSADGIKSPEFMEKVERFRSYVESLEVVNKVTSITATVKDLNKKLNNNLPEYDAIPDSKEKIAETLLLYTMGLPQGMGINDQVSVDNRFIKLVILWNLHDAETSLKLIDELNQKASEMGLDINITGKIVFISPHGKLHCELVFSLNRFGVNFNLSHVNYRSQKLEARGSFSVAKRCSTTVWPWANDNRLNLYRYRHLNSHFCLSGNCR